MHVYHTLSLTARAETDSALDPLRDALPSASDTRLHGVETDANGDVSGTPTKRDVRETTDPETGESVVSVMLAATDAEAASALWAELTDAVSDVDAEGTCHRQPLGSQSPSAVRDWYEAHPDAQPTDDEGNAVVPATWRADEHTVASL